MLRISPLLTLIFSFSVFAQGEPLFKNEPKIKVGKTSMCEMGPSGAGCTLIEYNGKELTCLVDFISVANEVFGFRCERGVTEEGFDELYDDFSNVKWDEKDRKLKFLKVKFPGYTKFSNSRSCQSMLAYWKLENRTNSSGYDTSATIFDIKTQKVLSIQKMGYSTFETDNLGHLPAPEWSTNCTQAKFLAPDVEKELKPRVVILKPKTLKASK